MRWAERVGEPSLGAMEAIKVLAGLGEPLAGHLLTCDLRDMTFRKRTIRRDPTCRSCGWRWSVKA